MLLGASGLIAFIGDALGRRIGRKRLTVLGLRPRNTAILFTVVTGMIIAGLAVAAILLLSEDIRDRLLTYDEKVAQVTSLNQEVTRLEGSAETARGVAERAKIEAQGALGRQRDAETRAETAEAAVAAAQTRLAELESRRARAEAEVARARRAVEQALAARDAAERRRDEIAGQVAEADRELQVRRDELRAAGQEIDAAARLLTEAQRTFSAAQADLERAEEELAATQADLAQARADYGLATNQLRQARGDLRQQRAARLIYPSGGEIGRMRLVDVPGVSLLEQLGEFARRVNRTARDTGAGVPPNAPEGVYAIPVEGAGEAPPDLYLAALHETVQRVFRAGARAVWLRAVSVYNTVEGQPVFYQVDIVEDRALYSAGSEIARAYIDGALPAAEIIRQLQRLIQEEVNPEVAARGLLPSPDGRYTPIGPETWYPALEQIRATGGLVRVAVAADREIRTGDPLAVRFVVTHGD